MVFENVKENTWDSSLNHFLPSCLSFCWCSKITTIADPIKPIPKYFQWNFYEFYNFFMHFNCDYPGWSQILKYLMEKKITRTVVVNTLKILLVISTWKHHNYINTSVTKFDICKNDEDRYLHFSEIPNEYCRKNGKIKFKLIHQNFSCLEWEVMPQGDRKSVHTKISIMYFTLFLALHRNIFFLLTYYYNPVLYIFLNFFQLNQNFS